MVSAIWRYVVDAVRLLGLANRNSLAGVGPEPQNYAIFYIDAMQELVFLTTIWNIFKSCGNLSKISFQ
jgi:hypothetical protein